MPKRTREEKLAAYSKGAKRGYRARKTFLKACNELKMKEPSPGEVKAPIDDLGVVVAGRALGNAGPGDAAQTGTKVTSKCNLANRKQIVNRHFHP